MVDSCATAPVGWSKQLDTIDRSVITVAVRLHLEDASGLGELLLRAGPLDFEGVTATQVAAGLLISRAVSLEERGEPETATAEGTAARRRPRAACLRRRRP